MSSTRFGDLGKQVADVDPALAVSRELERRLQEVAGAGPLQMRHGERQRLAVVAGQANLGVKRVHMRRTARHEQENHPLGPRGEMAGASRKWVGRGQVATVDLVGQNSRQTQHAEAVGKRAKRLAAIGKAWIHREISWVGLRILGLLSPIVPSREMVLLPVGEGARRADEGLRFDVEKPSPGRKRPTSPAGRGGSNESNIQDNLVTPNLLTKTVRINRCREIHSRTKELDSTFPMPSHGRRWSPLAGRSGSLPREEDGRKVDHKPPRFERDRLPTAS